MEIYLKFHPVFIRKKQGHPTHMHRPSHATGLRPLASAPNNNCPQIPPRAIRRSGGHWKKEEKQKLQLPQISKKKVTIALHKYAAIQSDIFSLKHKRKGFLLKQLLHCQYVWI